MANSTIWPKRIQSEFTELQHQSEFIVAGVQLAIIALLFTIMLITPINYAPDAPIRSALLGLSLFTILVLLRLWFAYTRQLTRLMLGIFVICEMSLLLFTIWTYSLQFESTSTIVLKNPHVNYVYILIVLRALRFEPIWVILSGMTAIIGWSFIVWYVLYSDGMNTITWDYVTYASTRSVYLSAEFDKLLSIALVTFVIAYAINRAQNTLRQAVSQSFAAKDLSQFFDSAVVKKITQAEENWAPGQREMRVGVIMFVDLRGFSKLSEKLSSKDLLEVLSEYQCLFVPVIQKHQGSIDKFMGDGILASFGAIIPSHTFAADALNAVDEIMCIANQWKETQQQKGREVDIGMGLAMGEVSIGTVGNAGRLEYTLIGEAVNVAAKLEKHNKIEKVHALATYDVLDKAIKQNYQNIENKEIRPDRQVAGINQKINLVVLA